MLVTKSCSPSLSFLQKWTLTLHSEGRLVLLVLKGADLHGGMALTVAGDNSQGVDAGEGVASLPTGTVGQRWARDPGVQAGAENFNIWS